MDMAGHDVPNLQIGQIGLPHILSKILYEELKRPKVELLKEAAPRLRRSSNPERAAGVVLERAVSVSSRFGGCGKPDRTSEQTLAEIARSW
jgi:hypothetical protein